MSNNSFRFIWVYGNYKYFTLSVRGPALASIFSRLKSIPALKGLMTSHREMAGSLQARLQLRCIGYKLLAELPACSVTITPILTSEIRERG